MIHLSSRIGGGDHARQVYRPGRRISYIAPDKRVTANHPLRMVRDLNALSDLNRSRGKLYASEGRSFDPCRAIAERCCCRCSTASAGTKPIVGATALQSFIPLVRGASPDDPVWDPTTFKKNESGRRTATCSRVHDQASEPSAGPAAAVGRAFLGARNADPNLGFKEFSGCGDDDDGTNFQGDKRKNDTMPAPATRTAAFIPGRSDGGQALLYWPRHHGEPAWAGCGRQGHAWQWYRRTPASETMLKVRRKAAGRR